MVTSAPRASRLSRAFGCCLLLVAAGCRSGVTYPKERLAASLQDILTQEKLDSSVRFLDHTLAVQVAYPDVLTQTGMQISIGPALDEASRKVLTAVHRVLLSSDAHVDFYVLLLSDPKVPGAYLTIVRYMDDIRRAYANMLNTPEMLARTIFEVNFVPQTPLTLEQYVPRDIRLEEFLSWQVAKRIQYALMDEAKRIPGTVEVGRCGGEFENGEFVFTLNVVPREGGSLDDAVVQQLFQTSTNVIAKVLSSYRFESFNAVRLVHTLSGRNLVLPKTHLQSFR